MPTTYEQKAAFDAVDDATPISADQIAELVRNFAVVSNKQRLAAMVTVIALSLEDIGVETYGDMRRVTSTMYVEECGVKINKKLDAQRLVEQFTRQVTAEAHGDAPEIGARVTQPDVVGTTPEGVKEAAFKVLNFERWTVFPCRQGKCPSGRSIKKDMQSCENLNADVC